MRLFAGFVLVVLTGCAPSDPNPLFTDITTESGIGFQNDLHLTRDFNPYTYRNFYNGAGVAVGDVNNDGLLDIYFAGNQVDNRLYLNLGNMMFKDVTQQAGVACHDVWCTGVTFVDINGDGFLDIYVCKSGDPDALHRNNELFVNNGDLTFTEKAREYGLDFTGLSVQASFFDYDKDGDLDCYLLTNSIKSVGQYDFVKDQRQIPDPNGGGNKFLINEDGRFRDYSKQAGIYTSSIGFGLGITLGDFNEDGWTDIFVSNDFFERDYLYINTQHGGFVESLTDYFQSISMGSMGADFADLDGDGVPELFVTEMLPDSLNRRKTKTVYESWDKYQWDVENGYFHQFPRNVLNKKIGTNTYAEVGRLAGIAASEWSWGALLFDMDNDGRRDVFVANGIYKDLLDRDYLTYSGSEENVRELIREDRENAVLNLINKMPSSPVPNYAYRNMGDFNFKNVSAEWGFGEPMYSSGSVYGDLDNDGDLDLVVSNINASAVLYRNNSDSAKFKSIDLALHSKSPNTAAIGTYVSAYCGDRVYFGDNFVTRGFQSSVCPWIHLGLGESVATVDSIIIRWPGGGVSALYDVKVNRTIQVNEEDSARSRHHINSEGWAPGAAFAIKPVSSPGYTHKASGLVDFNRDRLLPMMYSNETPFLTRGDIDQDGSEEVYVGGGKAQPGAFLHADKGKFTLSNSPALSEYALSEETGNLLVDLDGDGDLDLYMACGGRFFPKTSSALMDHVFLNDGKGEYSESPYPLPFTSFVSTSAVVPIDFDRDGDVDLVVGERFNPFIYGTGGRAYLFENDGRGAFADVTAKYAAPLVDVGMVTAISCEDVNNDGWRDIVLVGDWMPVIILLNDHGHMRDASMEMGLQDTEGWWRDVASGDFNQDGKVDFVLANHGQNTFFKPGDRMYVDDFDRNGSVEQIFCTNVDGKYFPVVDRDELVSQLPLLKKDLLYYRDYARKSIDEIFGQEVLGHSSVLQVKVLSSMLLLSDSSGYHFVPLPLEAQYSPIYSLLVDDFDDDGVQDLIAGGNQYGVKPQFGRYDASEGWFFKGVLKSGSFSFQGGKSLNVRGQIRDIAELRADGKRYLLFTRFNDEMVIYEIQN